METIMRFFGWLVLVLSGLFYAGVSAATFEADNDTPSSGNIVFLDVIIYTYRCRVLHL